MVGHVEATLSDLKDLIQMKEDGHISDDDYQRLKAAIISQVEAAVPRTATALVPRQRRELNVPEGVGGSSAWFKAANAKVSFGPDADVNLYRASEGVLKTARQTFCTTALFSDQ